MKSEAIFSHLFKTKKPCGCRAYSWIFNGLETGQKNMIRLISVIPHLRFRHRYPLKKLHFQEMKAVDLQVLVIPTQLSTLLRLQIGIS